MGDSVENVQTIKCMILGDSLTGKTYLFRKFTNQPLPTKYIPTVFEVSNIPVESNTGQKLNLSLWDSAGSHIYDNIRPISYAHTDCFILCYNADDEHSIENIRQRWIPEIQKHGDGPTVPIILVSTKFKKKLQDGPENTGANKISNTNRDIESSCQATLQELTGAKAIFACSIAPDMLEHVDDILQTSIDLACAKKEDDDKPSDPIWKFCSPTIAFLGDTGVGKSSIIEACLNNKPLQNDPDNRTQEYYHDFVIDGCEYFVRFLEHPGESGSLSTIIHENNADVIVLCYAINDPFSFQKVESLLQNFQDQPTRPPIIIAGTKCDLKDESLSIIPSIDGEFLKENMSCAAFIECSARTLENVSKLIGAMQDSIKI